MSRFALATKWAKMISLIASGVAFCDVLAMVPIRGEIVLNYGLIASPKTVVGKADSTGRRNALEMEV